MDRLPPLALALALALAPVTQGCDDGAATVAPQSRVVAVNADPEDDPADTFCDVQPEDHPALTLPALAEGETAPRPGRRRWLNVWATWCRPCVEEMPLLEEWRGRLAEDGVDMELVFLSADADAETVSSFQQEHPGIPETLRIGDPSTLPEWAPSVGLDRGATLPIHVLTDGQGRVSCARTGSLSEEHYAAVRSILRR